MIDFHAHIMASGSFEVEKQVNELIESNARYDIELTCLSRLGGYYPAEDEIEECNRTVAGVVKRYPKEIAGFCYLNPAHENSVSVLNKYVLDFGMRGVKLWVAVKIDDERVFPVIERSIELNIPVLVHVWSKTIGQLPHESRAQDLANTAKRYPEAKFVMAHLGGNAYSQIKPVISCKNVSVDFSGTVYRRDDIDYAKKYLGAERIVFGTDRPIADPLLCLGQVLEADLTNAERELILSDNARNLLRRRK